MRILALLGVLAAGCAAPVQPWVGDPGLVDGQAEAERIVWRDAYGRAEAPPAVLWRADASCPGKPSPGWLIAGRCASGAFYDDWHAEVARPEGGPVGLTTYAHELCHAARLLETGDPDRGHLGGCFADGRAAAAAEAVERVEGLLR